MQDDIKLDTNYVMRLLHENELYYFSASTLSTLMDVPVTRGYQVVRRLITKSLVRPVEAGKYLLLGYHPEKVLSNAAFIAARLAHPSYVSFWSALHFHGLTEQAPRTVYLATTRQRRTLQFNEATFIYVRLAPSKFFGYQRETIADLPVLVADLEKSIVDSLDQLRYAGGLLEAAKALHHARERLDVERLVDYANRMRNLSLGSRLGFLLEKIHCPVEGLHTSRSFVRLDPHAEGRGVYDQRWRLRVNVPEEELMSWRET